MNQHKHKEYRANKPSREEDYIKFYFENSNLKFVEEYRLDNLKYDTKSHRRVDFYLNRLDVYVEYYGMYNSTKENRIEYDKKTEVYFKNGLPTIILYPHELGFLDYAFHTKMTNLFSINKFKNKKSYFYRYMFVRYLSRGKWKSLFVSAFWAYLFIVFESEIVKLDEGLNAIFFIISFFLTLHYLLTFLFDIFFFIKQKGVCD